MAYQLKSNPLENNPLFSTQPQSDSAPKQPAQEPKSEKKTKKSARKSSDSVENKIVSAETPVPATTQDQTHEKKQDMDAYTRATFIVRRDLLKLLKDYAYTERLEIKEVINEILCEALTKIETDYAADGRHLISHK